MFPRVCVFGYRLLLGQWQGSPQPHYSLLLSQTSTTATSRSPFSFIYCITFFAFPPSTLPIRECWWDVFAESKRGTQHPCLCCWVTGCWQEQDVLFYIRDAFVCWGLTHLTHCQNPPFSPLKITPSFYDIASMKVCFFEFLLSKVTVKERKII